MAKISIRRFSNPVGAIQKYCVVINQTESGTIKNNEVKDFEVTPGPISLYVKSPWSVSETIEFSATVGKTVFLAYHEQTVTNSRAMEICTVLGIALTVAFYNILTMPMAFLLIGPVVVSCGYWILQKLGFLPAFVKHKSDLHVCEVE